MMRDVLIEKPFVKIRGQEKEASYGHSTARWGPVLKIRFTDI